MDSNPTNSLIDEFEASFMNCTCAFTKQESSIDVDKGKLTIFIQFLLFFIQNSFFQMKLNWKSSKRQ